ncbi:MAG: CBS domain-containing protein, partial [Acidimicrobiales bacterium]
LSTRLVDIAVPVAEVAVGRPHESMGELLERMAARGGAPAVVLDDANRLAGIVTAGDVERAARFGRLGAGT